MHRLSPIFPSPLSASLLVSSPPLSPSQAGDVYAVVGEAEGGAVWYQPVLEPYWADEDEQEHPFAALVGQRGGGGGGGAQARREGRRARGRG